LRGVGMVWGIYFPSDSFASSVSEEAFKRGLIIETAGANGRVLKFLPALTIDEALIEEGLAIVDVSVEAVLEKSKRLRVGNLI